jgi:hypothetical protein
MNLLYATLSDQPKPNRSHDRQEQWHLDASTDAQRRGPCQHRVVGRGNLSQSDEEVTC